MADIFEAYKENQGNASSNKEIKPLSLNEKLRQLKESFEEAIGITVSDDAYKILIEEKFSNNIADLISRILTEIINNGVVINKDILLKESDKGIILRDVETILSHYMVLTRRKQW